MKKTMVFIMALIMLFFFCACSAEASSNNIDFDNNKEAFKQLPDLDMGQNIYENFNREEHNKTAFVFNTPFGPININQIPPFFDIPIQWNQKYSLSGEIPIV